MYPLDTNINTAIERQADRVRAVQAYGSRQSQEPAADGTDQANPVALSLLSAATILMLVVVVGLLVH